MFKVYPFHPRPNPLYSVLLINNCCGDTETNIIIVIIQIMNVTHFVPNDTELRSHGRECTVQVSLFEIRRSLEKQVVSINYTNTNSRPTEKTIIL